MTINILKGFETSDLLNNHQDNYIESLNIFLHVYAESMVIIDLENALKVGKTCTRYCIRMEESEQNFACDFINWMDDWGFDEFIDCLREGSKFRGVMVEKNLIRAVNVFSPFVEVKPIKTPNKWTLPHIWKAILSGQIKKGVCTGKYTDDYAYDAETNFGKGDISLLRLAQRIIESPSGWWVSPIEEKEGLISLIVNCHHFDCNEVYFAS